LVGAAAAYPVGYVVFKQHIIPIACCIFIPAVTLHSVLGLQFRKQQQQQVEAAADGQAAEGGWNSTAAGQQGPAAAEGGGAALVTSRTAAQQAVIREVKQVSQLRLVLVAHGAQLQIGDMVVEVNECRGFESSSRSGGIGVPSRRQQRQIEGIFRSVGLLMHA
jgi:hypothetical protein